MADQTIVALYDDAASARQVLNDLKSSGLPHSQFWISGDTAGTADLGESRLSDLGRTFTNPGDRVQALTRLGVPEEDAHVYAEGVRRGGTLLIGDVDDDATERALDIIERHNPVDLAERGEHYRSSGWSGYDAGADYSADQAAEERRLYGTGISDAAAGFRDANRTSPATPPATAPSTEAGRVATGRSDVETGREER